VLDLAAEKSGWGQPLPKGSGRGVSVQNVFGSYMAQVAEVAVSKDGDVAVKRITCAVDCGIGINPNTIEAQAQSAILYGLTAALYGEITLKDGRVEQSNFDSYRALRINEIPAIAIHIIDSGEAPGGMGEPETCAVPASGHQCHFRGDRRAAAQASYRYVQAQGLIERSLRSLAQRSSRCFTSASYP